MDLSASTSVLNQVSNEPTDTRQEEEDVDGDLLANKVSAELSEPPEGIDVYTDDAECVICEVKFINNWETKIHRMIHSDNHNCFVCQQFVKNRFQFVGHVRKHMCVKPFRCPVADCDKTFANVRETKLHQRVHSDDRPYMCTECGKAFKQISTLRDHEVVHTGEKRFKCKICEGAFATATSLRRHVRVMHEAVRSFLCHFCEECFTSKQALKQHMVIHRDEDPLKCQLCGEKLPDEEAFTVHKNKHIELKQSGHCEYCANKTFYFGLKEHIEKKHQPRHCEICSLVFYDDKSMDNHRRSHLEIPEKEDLICKLCGKQFEFPRYLKAHMKRHEDDYKKFKCDLCEKAFSSKRDLNDHLMVHADIKNYRCDICDKAFRTKQSVNKHMPIHSDKRPFQCKLCPKQFKKQSILRKHLISHSRIRPHGCDLCGKSYKSKESLRVHKFTHRKDKHKCKVCGKSFKFVTLFKKHKCTEQNVIVTRKKRCSVCKRKLKSAVTHAYHVLMHAKISSYKCDKCNNSCRYKYSLKLHKNKQKRTGVCDVKRDLKEEDEIKDECDNTENTVKETCLDSLKPEFIEVKAEES